MTKVDPSELESGMGVEIFVNGKRAIVSGMISYEQIINLAGGRAGDSVEYLGPRHGDTERSGCLCAGMTIATEPGMRFDSGSTGNA